MSADLTDACLPGCHLEVKYRKQHAVWKFMRQAISDAKDGRLPVVLLRADGRQKGQEEDFLVMFRLKDARAVAQAIARMEEHSAHARETDSGRGAEEET